jgi:hypothetical protein
VALYLICYPALSTPYVALALEKMERIASIYNDPEKLTGTTGTYVPVSTEHD